MTAFNADWSLMTPEIVLAILALTVFTVDFTTGIRGKKPFIGTLSVISLLITIVLVVIFNQNTGSIGDMFVVDPFAMLFKIVILIGVALVILTSMSYMDKHQDMYQGEMYSLLLFAALGAMLMVSSADLITLFVGLELLSISSYCLAGFRKNQAKSTEAALKYVVLGGTASAFILYGMSFMYGLTGSTSLVDIGTAMPMLYAEYQFLVIMSLFFMIAGFGFKISVVPFHMWAPDVYEGAPTPITGFLTAVSKIAGFAILIRILAVGFGAIYHEWYFIIAVIAALTMIIGNTVALVQSNIKRLMAYSGIAQAGYLLIPLAASLSFNITMSMIVYYAFAYVFMTLGAFAIISYVTEDANNEDISSFAGLYKRSPFLAHSMTVFLVSMAGLPITAGFVGKVYIFLGLMTSQMIWLAVIMIVTSTISFFYYFTIIKQMYMREPSEEGSMLKAPTSISLIVTISLIGTFGLALFANMLTNYMNGLNWIIL
ncbi:NADH-quinone oxidoreductase subunit N [Anaerobacillus isosaccharinicus]|uniref:NADH-quinone oxidoreductase subunit N n=1 Tax=Anaerobacillus isosaccharinicus TaxID=1532552 RepID=A0A1S2M6K0_9BACI|nr:NADH-quinone oxidoreductase subunit N [Anaerobacillus isosaccharinicus]MBA5584383.1 NADH-quinone oxidoreductase subunit N [Anaerobacillus isosaccharinicus]QOY37224.1 NADH-quinone oxidoreductase subunit N [Anaerobacillus isosaccharinicus]